MSLIFTENILQHDQIVPLYTYFHNTKICIHGLNLMLLYKGQGQRWCSCTMMLHVHTKFYVHKLLGSGEIFKAFTI